MSRDYVSCVSVRSSNHLVQSAYTSHMSFVTSDSHRAASYKLVNSFSPQKPGAIATLFHATKIYKLLQSAQHPQSPGYQRLL